MRRLIPLLFLSFLAFLGGLGWMVSTETGVRSAVDVVQRLFGPELTISRVQGDLLNGLTVERIGWRDGDTEISLEGVLFRWSPRALFDRRIHLRELSIRVLRLRVPSSEEKASESPTLPSVRLPLALDLDLLHVQRLEWSVPGDRPFDLGPVTLSLSLEGSRLELRRLTLSHSAGRVRLQGEATLTGAYPLALMARFAWQRKGAPALEGRLVLEGDLDGLALKSHFESPLQARVEGRIAGIVRRPEFDLTLTAEDLDLSVLDETLAGWRLSGRTALSGDPARQAIEGRVVLASPLAAEPLEMTVEANLEGRRLVLDPVMLEMADSRLVVNGEVSIEQAVVWNLVLAGEALDPSLLAPGHPGRLTLQANSRGRWRDGVRGEVVIDRLAGVLHGRPLMATGRFHLDGDELMVEGFDLGSGNNRLHLQGKMGGGLGLDLRLEAMALGELVPGWSGRLWGTGRLEGTKEAPGVRLHLFGEAVSGAGLMMDQMRLEADYPADPTAPMALELVAETARWQGAPPARLAVRVGGPRERSRVKFTLDQPQPGRRLELIATASLDPAFHLRGRVEHVEAVAPETGKWALEAPVSFDLDWPRVRLENACLSSGSGRFCARYHAEAEGRWKGELDLHRLDLNLLSPWMPSKAALQGHLEGWARLQVGSRGVAGELDFHAPRAELPMETLDPPLKLDLSGSAVVGRLDASGVSLDLEFPLGTLGGLEGRIELPGWVPARPASAQPVSGRFEGRLVSLAPVASWLPQLTAVRGEASIDLRLDGRLAAPHLFGEARTRGLAFEVPALGLVVEKGMLAVRGDGDGLTFQGRLEAGEGRVDLSGEARLDPASGWPIRGRLESRRFPLIWTPEYRAVADSDLMLAHDAGGVRLTGRVTVPEAVIRPRGLPQGAVAPSPDVVLVGESEKARTLPVHAEVELVLGPRVRIDAFDLRGRVAGRVTLVERPGQPTLGRGELELMEGRYRLFGSDLEVRQGRLVFAGGPVTNPALDLDLVRTIEGENLVVGARIGGTLRRPGVTLHSDPSLPDVEILSYLTTGHGTDGRGDPDLANQALMLASGRVLGRVGDRLGLDRLELEEGEDGALALAMGYWLSPRVFVEYVAGLREEGNSVRLRYDVNRNLQIETESGRTQSVDLFYTFER